METGLKGGLHIDVLKASNLASHLFSLVSTIYSG